MFEFLVVAYEKRYTESGSLAIFEIIAIEECKGNNVKRQREKKIFFMTSIYILFFNKVYFSDLL